MGTSALSAVHSVLDLCWQSRHGAHSTNQQPEISSRITKQKLAVVAIVCDSAGANPWAARVGLSRLCCCAYMYWCLQVISRYGCHLAFVCIHSKHLLPTLLLCRADAKAMCCCLCSLYCQLHSYRSSKVAMQHRSPPCATAAATCQIQHKGHQSVLLP